MPGFVLLDQNTTVIYIFRHLQHLYYVDTYKYSSTYTIQITHVFN